MADYPTVERSPYFKTFSAHRMGNVARRWMPVAQGVAQHSREAEQLRHYPLLRGLLSRPAPPRMQRQAPVAPMALPVQQVAQQQMQAQHAPPPYQIPPPQVPQHHEVAAAPLELAQPNAAALGAAPLEAGLQNAVPVLPNPPAPPQTMAEHFSQINRGLPDGVQFEPLDDETKAILRQMKIAPPEPPNSSSAAPAAPVSPPSPGPIPAASIPVAPTSMSADPLQGNTLPRLGTKAEDLPPAPTASIESAALLERLIQDDRNAALYYRQLSEIAPGSELEENLLATASDCENRCKQFQALLLSLHKRSHEPNESAIGAASDFHQGIRAAVVEERKILNTMAELIELLEEPGKHLIQSLLNKRLIRLTWLHGVSIQMN